MQRDQSLVKDKPAIKTSAGTLNSRHIMKADSDCHMLPGYCFAKNARSTTSHHAGLRLSWLAIYRTGQEGQWILIAARSSAPIESSASIPNTGQQAAIQVWLQGIIKKKEKA